MSGSPPLSFSTSRRGPRRWVRVVTLLLIVVLVVTLIVAAIGGGLWGYAWWQLGARDLPSLSVEDGALGAAAPSAPEGVTTLLVVVTEEPEERDPQAPALAAPVALVQGGGARGDDAVAVLLPPELAVSSDGEGTTTLAEVQRDGGLDAVARAVVDYTEVRVDHAVTATVAALPRAVETVGAIEACGGEGCRTVTAGDVEERVDVLRALEPGQDATAAVNGVIEILRGLAGVTDVPGALRSPIVAKRLIDVVAGEVATDVSLRGGGLLTVAGHLSELGEVVVLGLPALRNPDSGQLLVLPEQAATRFAALREGGVPPTPEEDDPTAVLAETTVAVLNGTGTDGFAGRLQVLLEAEGARVVGTGNAPSFSAEDDTVVRHQAGDPTAEAAAILLARALGDVSVVAEGGELSFEGDPVDVIVVGGADLDEQDEED